MRQGRVDKLVDTWMTKNDFLEKSLFNIIAFYTTRDFRNTTVSIIH